MPIKKLQIQICTFNKNIQNISSCMYELANGCLFLQTSKKRRGTQFCKTYNQQSSNSIFYWCLWKLVKIHILTRLQYKKRIYYKETVVNNSELISSNQPQPLYAQCVVHEIQIRSKLIQHSTSNPGND